MSCSSSVCGNASEKKSFTVSYLINSCGLSSNDAVSASKKVCFKSPEKPDAVLDLLRNYGFTNADISRIVATMPNVLLSSPNKTLLPRLQFLQSIGVPLPVLAHNLSVCPSILRRNLKTFLFPLYNYLKNLLRSDKGVVHVFSRAPRAFSRAWSNGVYLFVSVLRERGVPESSIVSLVMYSPPMLATSKEKVAVCIDRAVEIGFDINESGFVHAMKVLLGMSESTLKRKMEVYRMCGWSESETVAVFLKHPYCLKYSEKKIMANMGFLVDELGCKPLDVARYPVLLGLSLDKRIKPRCLVAGILKEKGLKSKTSLFTLLTLSEEKFLDRYILKFEKDVPELRGIYFGKVEPSGMDFGRLISSINTES
ncbi:hypothetical protein PHJA_002478400 [Phtheirospermum japonicum]|uniref:Mitochondrial transcription termination factor n=1 Tax=Phtheirospermum japonicum TaxID=374723 RepID=A0A830D861_9LAMI|nr:hypothetical protein PHJA_002478400 [Phtheirospermum japonicum]